MMKTNTFIIALLIAVAVVLELHPAIKENRVFIPEEVYEGKNCGCECIADSRPWYSVLNYWFWLWFLAVPLFIFSAKPQSPQWQRMGRTLGAVLLCYGAMNLAIHLMWDIRSGPFMVSSNLNTPWQKSWDVPGCIGPGMGANLIFTLYFGWIYAVLYTGWWEIIWYQYYKRRTGLIGPDFRRDIISKVIAAISYVAARLALLIIVALPFAVGILYLLEKFEILKGYQSFFP